MAQKKKNYTSTRKVKKRTSLPKIVGYSLLGLLIFILAFAAFQFRDGFLYYLGFKSNYPVESLSKENRKINDIRIYEVLSTHTDTIFGFDVSEYQDKIDWENLGKVEDTFSLSFVFIRATAGKDRVDSKFTRNWEGAKKKGLLRGAYHYYRPNENSIKQADNFIKTVTLKQGDFPPVLDIEQLPKTQSIDSLKVGLKRWLTKIEKHYNVKPIIYSGESYYTDFLKKEFSEYPFWIANYNFWKKNPDEDWLLWQFTEKAQVEGVKGMIDLNVFNGDFVKLISITNQ